MISETTSAKLLTLIMLSFSATVSLLNAAVFTVTNTSNDVNTAGSLPWAITQANYASGGFDRIVFDIEGPGPHIITLQDATAFGGAGGAIYVNEQVSIDATTQPGYAGSPLIWINANKNASGFFLAGGDTNTISGFCVYNFTSNAITISTGSQGNWILNNWLGFAPASTGIFTNKDTYGNALTRGIGIQSSYNVLRHNTISGVDNGITIGEAIESTGSLQSKYVTNAIQYNFIGVDWTGRMGIGNSSDGIFLGAGAAYNFIGPGNIISDNESAGVELLHPSNIGNVIFGNVIGMDITATQPLPNKELGVLISNGASGNAVGGPFGGNFIGYNTFGGIALGLVNPSPGTRGNADSNFVQFNVLASGASNSLPFQTVGVSIEGGSTANVVQGNSIVGQKEHGVQIIGSYGNNVSNNWIGKNGFGIVFGNLGFGVFLNSANFNFVTGNDFGYNGLGPVGQVNSFGNAF